MHGICCLSMFGACQLCVCVCVCAVSLFDVLDLVVFVVLFGCGWCVFLLCACVRLLCSCLFACMYCVAYGRVVVYSCVLMLVLC